MNNTTKQKIKEILMEIIIDLVKTFLKISMSILLLWAFLSFINLKPIPLFELIQDTIDSHIKDNSRINNYFKNENSFIDEKTNNIDYSKYYNSKAMEEINLPIYLKLGKAYLDKIEKYNLNKNNTELLKIFTQELNAFHSKILLGLFNNEREAFDNLFKIIEKNKCTFVSLLNDENINKIDIYQIILSDIKEKINLVLIYFNKFNNNDKKYNENLSNFYTVAYSPYYTGGMCEKDVIHDKLK